MIGLEDRQSLSQEIGVAHVDGARLHLACEVAGIDLRTLQRWKAHAGLRWTVPETDDFRIGCLRSTGLGQLQTLTQARRVPLSGCHGEGKCAFEFPILPFLLRSAKDGPAGVPRVVDFTGLASAVLTAD